MVRLVVPAVVLSSLALGVSTLVGAGESSAACVERGDAGGTSAIEVVEGDTAHLYLADASGAILTEVSDHMGGHDPQWSPDGHSLLFVSLRGPDTNGEIWVASCDGSGARPLIASEGADHQPVWSPDGRHIAFRSDRDGVMSIYVADADGTNVRRVTDGGFSGDEQPAWLPDGTTLAYASARPLPNPAPVGSIIGPNATQPRIFVVPAAGGVARELALAGWMPRWSPDGTRVAYRSVRTMAPSYRVVNVDGTGDVLISPELARGPVTVPDDPSWLPYPEVWGAEQLCVARPSDGEQICDEFAWTPTSFRWSR